MIQGHSVPQAFASVVRRQPDAAALIAENGTSLSFAELDALRRRAAAALQARGVAAGDRVAIWAPNGIEWVIAGLAIHSLGAALVPINTRFRGDEAAYVLARSGAKLLFCAGHFLDQYYPAQLEGRWPDSLQALVVIGTAAAGDENWDAFLAGAGARPGGLEDPGPDAVMDIMFTSGTTGQPKGVVSCHGQNLRVIDAWCDVMGIGPEDRYLVANPFFHAFGYKVGWLGGLLRGCTVLPHAVFDAGAIIERIERERISVLPGPPTLFISLLDDPELARRDLGSLRATITGAAAVAPALIDRIRSEIGFEIVLTGYGLTETCGVVSLCDPDDDAETIVNTIGKPIAGIEVAIVDGARSCPAGEAGEIVVRGYNVMQGYLDDPEATAAAIDGDGWLHTGDIGFLDARGYLHITDRLKDMYIAGGFNVYPAEIERIIAGHPAVAQVAITGIPDERLGEVGKAWIVTRPGQRLDGEALISWCRERMANYKVPRAVQQLEALPLNAGGKVMKYRLKGA